MSKQM